jgi:hypothetical protein
MTKKPMTREMRDIQFTIQTPGFGALDKFIRSEEANLIRSLRKCPDEKIGHMRGRLDEAERILKFLGLKFIELDKALEMGEDFDKRLNEQNML